MKRMNMLIRHLLLVFTVIIGALSIIATGPPGGGGLDGNYEAKGSASPGVVSTIEVTKASSPIAGTKVVIPANALSPGDPTVNIEIDYEDNLPGPVTADADVAGSVVTASKVIVLSKDYPYDFNVPVEITVPYTGLPSDVPAVFYWSPSYNKYFAAGVKSVDLVNQTVTFTAIHFSKFVVMGINGLASSLLAADTGFRAATDGFYHPNFGSYDSPGGSCLGMANYSSWYYDNKKAADGTALFSKYRDGDPDRWQDDTRARELISRAFMASSQAWASLWMQTQYKLGPQATGLLLITAMKITKQPQTFLMADQWPGMQSGHATVVYKYDPGAGKFYIYDNNFRGEEQTIDWNSSTGWDFSNYTRAAAYSPAFTHFAFEAITSSSDVSAYENLYTGAEDGFSASKFNTVTVSAPTIDALTNAAAVPSDQNVTVSGTVSGGLKQAKYIVYRLNGIDRTVVNITGGAFSFTIAQLPNASKTTVMLVATDDQRNEWNAYAGFKEFDIKVIGTSFFSNLGFETGTFAGWWNERHIWGIAPVPMGGAGDNIDTFVPSDKSAIVAPGADPIIPAIQQVYAGNFAAQVNNSDWDLHISSVSQKAIVPAVANPQIQFYWAAVLENPGHPPEAQPYAEILVCDVTADPGCASPLYYKHFYSDDPAYQGWINGGNGWMGIDWQAVTIGLSSALVGHEILIQVTGADCAYSGHGGYVYLDGVE